MRWLNMFLVAVCLISTGVNLVGLIVIRYLSAVIALQRETIALQMRLLYPMKTLTRSNAGVERMKKTEGQNG
jgi:hypothetical protein